MAEKYREKQKELHMDFIDLEKAYDRIPRQELWRCLREEGTREICMIGEGNVQEC